MIDDWEVDSGHIADEKISFKEIFKKKKKDLIS